jgi:2-oxoisovalerate dehydrogenase E1 component beta subunit
VPVTIRVPYGGGIGAVEHHSESPEAYFAHTAGLRVVSCSSADDAYGMIQQAIASDDPVLFFEPKRRYWDKEDVDLEAIPTLGLYDARVVTEGTDLTVVAYGPMVATSVAAAREAATEGTSVEVIDLRSLSPIDFGAIERSVVFLGLGAEIAARISERCFWMLESPVIRVGGYSTPYPPSKVEQYYLPDIDRVLDAIDRSLAVQ